MNYYTIRFINEYSDLIITNADKASFEEVLSQAQTYIDNNTLDLGDDNITYVVTRMLKERGFTADFESPVHEY